jgi:hypothetical protein
MRKVPWSPFTTTKRLNHQPKHNEIDAKSNIPLGSVDVNSSKPFSSIAPLVPHSPRRRGGVGLCGRAQRPAAGCAASGR